MNEHDKIAFNLTTGTTMCFITLVLTDWENATFGSYFITIALWLTVVVGWLAVILPRKVPNDEQP